SRLVDPPVAKIASERAPLNLTQIELRHGLDDALLNVRLQRLIVGEAGGGAELHDGADVVAARSPQLPAADRPAHARMVAQPVLDLQAAALQVEEHRGFRLPGNRCAQPGAGAGLRSFLKSS